MHTLYPDLTFPDAPAGRPYVYLNMVATIDGKIVSGEPDEPVGDLGSALDHATMKVLEAAADAILIGAGTLRATPVIRYPKATLRVVVSRSGHVPTNHTFFTDAPDRAYVACPPSIQAPWPNVIAVGQNEVDLLELLGCLRSEFSVMRLLCEGGSELNAQLLALDAVDEIFLTIAPKIKLGRTMPTLAGGDPLPRRSLLEFDLLSCQPVASELFIRYRRRSELA